MQKYGNLMWAVAALIVVALSGCVTNNQRQKICATCTVKDSIVYKETIKLKDTTLYIFQQGPIQWLENPCKKLCDSLGNLKPFSITKKEHGITSTIKSVGNSIVFDAKADSLMAVIKGLQERTFTKSEVITRIEDCRREHRNWWDYFCRYFTYIVGPALLLWLGWRAFKLYFFKH